MSRKNHIKINDDQLTNWSRAGVDDTLVSDFLKKKLWKEANSLLYFYCFAELALILTLFWSLLFQPFWLSLVLIILVGIMLSMIYDQYQLKKQIRTAILEKQYDVCIVTVDEFLNDKTSKKCYIRDEEGHLLTCQEKNQEFPYAVTYHSYFSLKERTGVLVRMPYGTHNTYYIVLPECYLKEFHPHKLQF